MVSLANDFPFAYMDWRNILLSLRTRKILMDETTQKLLALRAMFKTNSETNFVELLKKEGCSEDYIKGWTNACMWAANSVATCFFPDKHTRLLQTIKILKNFGLQLYEFNYNGNIQYAFSTVSVEKIKQDADEWDHGGIEPPKLFSDTWELGSVKIINSIQDINEQYDPEEIPYCTHELIDNWKDWKEIEGLNSDLTDLEITIREFLS